MLARFPLGVCFRTLWLAFSSLMAVVVDKHWLETRRVFVTFKFKHLKQEFVKELTMSAKLPGKKRKLKEQEKLFEKAEEKKSKKQV
jgi:hypothetical protein